MYIDEAHGLGRGYGQFGLYEGWYSNGLATGYGRQIWQNRNYYVGQFQNGTISGSGLYVIFDTKRIYEGQWNNSVLIRSNHPDETEGFTIDMPLPPKTISTSL